MTTAHPMLTKKYLKKVGIRIGEMAKLSGVSRATFSYWVHGHTAPHPSQKRTLDRLMYALQSAHAAGALPIQGGARKDRMSVLSKLLDQHLPMHTMYTPAP